MKQILLKSFIIGAATLSLMSSCGEDRTGEYLALVKTQKWMYQTMQENYLYYEELPAEEKVNFFAKPHDFLSSLISDKDQKNGVKFSHLDSIYTQSESRAGGRPSFGFEGALVRVPNGSEAIRVIYTQKGSPAEDAQLKRGDWIIAADGNKINSNSYMNYVAHPTGACAFTLGSFNGEGFDTLNVVQLPTPRIIDTNNVLESHFVTSGNRKAFYMLYNEFGKDEEQLKEIFAKLASESFDDIILDLRYNPGGYVTTSQVVTSNLAPAEAVNQPFLKMTSNDKLNKTEIYNVDTKFMGSGAPLSYKNLYILTSGNTASAAEIVINGLKPYMKGRLFQVGTATFGKNVAQSCFVSEQIPLVEFWLTTFTLTNSEDFGDYFTNGLEPDYSVAEDLGGKLAPFGTPEDTLMVPVLHHMANGSFPTEEEKEQKMFSRANDVKVLYHSITEKPKWLKAK